MRISLALLRKYVLPFLVFQFVLIPFVLLTYLTDVDKKEPGTTDMRFPVKDTFIVFNIPATAGTTLLEPIYQKAKLWEKATFFPCHDELPCATTEKSIQTNRLRETRAVCAEVLLGHFTTGLVDKLSEIDSSSTSCSRHWNGEPTYSCLVAIQEPITRTISHYYQYLQDSRPEYNGRILTDLSMEQLKDVIGSSGGNLMLDFLSPDDRGSQQSLDEKLDSAQAFLSKCTIFVGDDWETSMKLMQRRAPSWLADMEVAAPTEDTPTWRQETIDDLSKEQMGLFMELLQLDIVVYQKGVKAYKKQLRSFNLVPGKELSVLYDDIFKDKYDMWSYPFIKAVTYFGRDSPLTFWGSDRIEDHIRQDFAQFLSEGFNTLILVIPWRGFQLSVVPPKYDKIYQERLEYILDVATEFNLFVIARVSYPHDSHPHNELNWEERCCRLLGTEAYGQGVRAGWLDYLSMLNGILTRPKYKKTYLYSFFSWEDLYCLIHLREQPLEVRRQFTEIFEFRTYVETKYTLEERQEIFGMESTDIVIPLSYDNPGRSYEVFIDFVDTKLWPLVLLGRRVHPRLTLEVRVDVEHVPYPDGTVNLKGYSLHHDDVKGPPRQAYYGSYMAPAGEDMNGAVAALGKVLARVGYNGGSPVILGQFNFFDNSPSIQGRQQMSFNACAEFLRQSVPLLRKYTVGYGIWAYRNYRQSEVFNGAFQRGMLGWEMQANGGGSASIGVDKYLVLSGDASVSDSYASVQQMGVQYPELACDEKNNNMELCFFARWSGMSNMKSRLNILWNHTQVHSLDALETWNEHCVRLPALGSQAYYQSFPYAFKVPHDSSVQIDRVQFFCRKYDDDGPRSEFVPN